LLVTSDTTKPFGSWPIVAYQAPHPAGPWSGPHLILDPPENAEAAWYTYNPTLVQLAGVGNYLLAYNVNAPYSQVRQDQRIFRPRFRRVRINGPCRTPTVSRTSAGYVAGPG
jgi:hypothetical protein